MKGKQMKKNILGIGTMLFVLTLIFSVGTASAGDPIWTANSDWDAPDVGSCAAPAFADLDGDGDYDLLIGTEDGHSLAYNNIGTSSSPTWTVNSDWNAPDVGWYAAPAFADLDGDGDYDLLIGAIYGFSFAYENTGNPSSPTWTANSDWDAPDVGVDAAPAFADLDGDGDYDLLIGDGMGVSHAYENTGTSSSPAWSANTGWNAPEVEMLAAPAFADLDGDGDYDLLIGVSDGVSYAYENTPSAELFSTIDIDPDTLNVKSKGKWITTYIELPEGYDVNDIDVGTVLLNYQVHAEAHPTEIGDYDNDDIADLMVKFDGQEVIAIVDAGDQVEITVTGKLTDGALFKGIDTIRVIDK